MTGVNSQTAGGLRRGRSHRSRVRWFVLFMISLMYLITYMDRANISVTATPMASEFGLSKTEMGLVFSAFAWAYAIGQIPGGWLADRFGPKRVLLVIVTFWSIMTAITSWASGLISLFVIRFIFGLGEAGAFPTATRAMQLWFPKQERGIIQGVTHCFSRLAVAATPFIAVTIMTAFGWRWCFIRSHCSGSFGRSLSRFSTVIARRSIRRSPKRSWLILSVA
jgi:MFS family permease